MPDADVRIGGRYRLTRRLAAGGMGTVWQAWDETLRRDVAVKRVHLPPGLSDAERQAAVDRAMREGRITARLHHPNAVPVYDVVDDDHGPCLVMQYVPSRSLATVVAEDGPLPPDQVARVGTQIAAALAAAHRVGIVHRDVKPGNVLMAEDGSAKITDFGVSHALDDVTVTSTGLVTGTPAFIAPEVARGEPSGPASDVYSLGSTLYHAVEGVAPFGTEANPMAVLHRVASGRYRPAERAGALTPILERMMAPSPADRPAMVDVAGMLPDLHRLDGATADGRTQVLRAPPQSTQRMPSPPTTPTTPTAAPVRAAVAMPVAAPTGADQPPRRPPRDDGRDRRGVPWLPIVAAVLVVLLGAVVLVALLRRSDGSNSADPGTSRSPSTTASSRSSAPATSSRPSTTASSSAVRSSSTSPPSTSASTSASVSSTVASSRPAGGGKVTDAQLADAVQTYFQLVPGNLDAGWDMLTPAFQQGRAGGRDSYDQYWGSVDRVDAEDLQGNAPNRASATLVYHYKDGRVVRQQTDFRFKRVDGELKIDDQS